MLPPETLARNRALLRLARTGAAPIRLNRLLDSVPLLGDIFSLSPTQIVEIAECTPATAARILDGRWAGPDGEVERLAAEGVQIVCRLDPDYPALLREIYDPPPVLFVRGRLDPTPDAHFTVVGSRRCDEYGRGMTGRLVRGLVEAGFAVASGLALGIDAAAHRAALDAGGRTVAVLGSALDRIYPQQNQGLAEELVTRGALISEYPPGVGPQPWRFPARNRILAGLSRGVLIVQAPVGSGSLITARCAGDENREVFAVPGPVTGGRHSGCHQLIQDGARLVESVEHILSELGQYVTPGRMSRPAPPAVRPGAALPEVETKVLAALRAEPRHVDELCEATGLPASLVSGSLLVLELQELARRLPGNLYQLPDA